MKDSIRLLSVLLIIILNVNISFGAIPSYNLFAKEFTLVSPNTLEFEIRLIHTNPDSSVFLYSMSQYLFDFNPDYANGGTLTLTKLDSELPEGLQPYNLSVIGSQLLFPGGYFTSNYPSISASLPGTLIIKARLQTSAPSFNGSLDLSWRNGPINTYTRIKAFINNWNTEITNPLHHFIDIPTGLVNSVTNVPLTFSLSQNYPNPFNPVTVIRYSLSENRFVNLKIFDILGNEVATLVNEKQNRGSYNYQFSIVNYQLSSGIYFYKLEAGSFVETKRMMLLK